MLAKNQNPSQETLESKIELPLALGQPIVSLINANV